jgi:ligand-binding sensor domain-containing protein/signal transduction histidine kinase
VSVFAASSNETSAVSPDFVVEQMDIGLPQSSVISITQTRDGYLWLGTLKGLVRSDGVTAEVFDDQNTPGLNDNAIVYLFEDTRSNLWVGTLSAGIAVIQNGRVIPTDMGKQSGQLMSACEDSTGRLWFYCANGTLWRFGDGVPDVSVVARGVASRVRQVIAEKSGALWVATDEKLRGINPHATFAADQFPIERVIDVKKLDFLLAARTGGYWRLADGRIQLWQTNQLVRDLGSYPWKTNASVQTACEDRDGNLVVGTLNVNDGVYWFDAEGKAARISHAEGLSHDGILSLCIDEEGSLWVGTDGGGLNRVKKSFCRILETSRAAIINSMAEDDDGGLWIGWGGGAKYLRNRLSDAFIPSLTGEEANITCLYVDQAKRVWAGTRLSGLFRWDGNQFMPVREMSGIGLQIFAIHQDRKGDLWIGSRFGLVRWNEREWKPVQTTRAVRAIADDAAGNLWFGTDGDGLCRLRENNVTTIHKADGLPSERISALWVDRDDVLWVGTDGGGLGRFQNGKWTRFSKDQGLPSNSIAYVIDDNQGGLWIGSNAGLTRVPKAALAAFANRLTNTIPCRTYGKEDGLPTLECTQGSQPAACRARDGKLWFPTIRGLVSVDPAGLKTNFRPPPVKIESVFIDGQSQQTNSVLGPLKQIVVQPYGQRLEIHFTSLNLGESRHARFKYQMENHETGWSPVGSSRVASYTRLPPGDYTFRVTACNEDGIWNEQGSSLSIIVLPAFWQTWWFRGLVAVGLLGLIAGAVFYVSTQKLQRQLAVLKQQEALEKERARIARDLHDQLGANLTQVALLGEMVEEDRNLPKEVESHAKQISQTARETSGALDEIVWAANPANDTLDSLATYACKYAQDYLSLAGLRHRVDLPTDLPETPLAPDVRHNVFLAFKESINNVVKHAQASEARVRLRLEDSQFILEIEDNGRGPADAEKKTGRNGLRNMRKRMEDVGGSFSIGPASERGTLVRLTAPLAKN